MTKLGAFEIDEFREIGRIVEFEFGGKTRTTIAESTKADVWIIEYRAETLHPNAKIAINLMVYDSVESYIDNHTFYQTLGEPVIRFTDINVVPRNQGVGTAFVRLFVGFVNEKKSFKTIIAWGENDDAFRFWTEHCGFTPLSSPPHNSKSVIYEIKGDGS